jgi:hypothetical protein
VQSTGLGEIAAVGDAESLAAAILTALTTTYDHDRARAVLESTYLPPVPERAYAEVFAALASETESSSR